MYAKIFASLYQGTLRGNSHGILVFTNMLAHCDQAGVCDMHPRSIADEVGLTVAEVQAAINMLESADAESRSPEEDGRRIIRLDEHRAWGWQVVNYAKYRAIRSEEDRREQNRRSQAAWRAKRAAYSNQNKPASAEVSHGKPKEKEKENEITPPTPPQAGGRFADFWNAYPRTVRKVARMQCLVKWQRHNLDSIADQVISALNAQSRSMDWTKDGGAFIPAPLVWLNQARWEAPIEPEKAAAGNGTGELERMKAERSAPMPADVAAKLAALAGKMRAQ